MTLTRNQPPAEDGLVKNKTRTRATKTGTKMPNDQATVNETLHPNLTVGEALKKSRLGQKIQLRTVADKMRIRLEYLEAIENGHFKRLPGMAYGIGFVRTYAEFLGLEAQPLIDQFKAENSTVTVTPINPPPKVKLEITGINFKFVVIGGGALALGFMGWYLFSGSSETPPRVSEIPPKIAASVANPQAPTAPQVTSLAVVPTDRTKSAPTLSAPTLSAPAQNAPQAVQVQPQVKPPATMTKPPAPIFGQGSNPSPLFKPRATAESPAANPPAAVTSPAAPAPVAKPKPFVAQAPTLAQPAAPKVTPVAPVQEIPKLKPPVAADLKVNEAVTSAPIVQAAAGQLSLSSANQPVWIEVTNSAGKVVKSKTLMPGESYLVPPVAGLKLTTGNAGGLIVMMNGKIAPKLGEVGKTKRGISLDASLFQAGEQ